MALKRCRHCGKKVSIEAPVCLGCGGPNPVAAKDLRLPTAAERKRARIGLAVLAGMIALAGGMAMRSCAGAFSSSNAPPADAATTSAATLISAGSIVGHSPAAVDALLGPPSRTGTEGGFPSRAYKSGAVEVVFVGGRAEWITVFARDIEYDRSAVNAVGLRCPAPTFANEYVIRWEDACGVRSVQIFSDNSGDVRYLWIVATTMP